VSYGSVYLHADAARAFFDMSGFEYAGDRETATGKGAVGTCLPCPFFNMALLLGEIGMVASGCIGNQGFGARTFVLPLDFCMDRARASGRRNGQSELGNSLTLGDSLPAQLETCLLQRLAGWHWGAGQ